MELRSRVLAEDICPGVPGPSTLATEGSGEIVPVCVASHSSTEELVTGASSSHSDAARLKGAALSTPIASSPQMSGMAGAKLNLDVEAEKEISHDVEPSSGLEMGLGVQPAQPPRPPPEIGITTSDVSVFTGISGLVSTSGPINVLGGISGSHSGATPTPHQQPAPHLLPSGFLQLFSNGLLNTNMHLDRAGARANIHARAPSSVHDPSTATVT